MLANLNQMPFLTFQTVKEQRKRRQDIAFSEFAGRSHAPKSCAASQTDPKNHAKETYKHLAREAASMLRSKPSESTKLSQEMIHKALRCVTRNLHASGQDKLDAEGAAKLLGSHISSMDKDDVDGKPSPGAAESSMGTSFWKGKSSESPQKKESTTDMNGAIEYLIDALSLCNRSKYSSDSAAQSEESTMRTDGSVGREESGQKRQRHESRTLDQYFYSSLPDTVRRDADQVILRYQARKRCLDEEEHASEKGSSAGQNPSLPAPGPTNNPTNSIPQSSNKETEKPQADDVNTIYLRYQEKFKLCMVDQLWLWVLDDSKNLYYESGNILCEAETSLETIITCFPHTETNGDQETEYQKSPLDLISDHINRDMRPQIRNVYDLAALITSFYVGDLDLKDDIELLEEIKDIRDELNILERILDDQDDLTQKLFNLFDIDEHESTSTRHLQDQVLQYYQQRAGVGLRLDRIKKMDEDAKISYDAVGSQL
ncbi:hypothetical protein N7488_001297 [Penicillium malachiteum]|nr:hypothetical protein N7488_001297 [Penicillium malachiteum]